MASSREQEKAKEVVHELFRAACFIRKLFPLCPPYPSLNGIPVQPPKNLLQARSDVELMEAVQMAGLQTTPEILNLRQRPELDVLVSLQVACHSQPFHELAVLTNVIQEGITMVCKWQ